MRKFEYEVFKKNINIDGGENNNIKKFMNKLGDQGWEIVRDTVHGVKDKPMLLVSCLCKREKTKIIKP